MLLPGIKLGPPDSKSYTLPRQGSTSVSYTYHNYSGPFLELSANLNLSNHSVPGHQASWKSRSMWRQEYVAKIKSLFYIHQCGDKNMLQNQNHCFIYKTDKT